MQIREKFGKHKFEGGEKETKKYQSAQELEDSLGVGYENKSLIGGCLSLLAILIILLDAIYCWKHIYIDRKYSFMVNNFFFSPDAMSSLEINLGVFPYYDSGRFIFGLTGGDIKSENFDILNNPYIEMIGAQMTSGEKLNLDSVHELKYCKEEHLKSFMEDHTL